MELRVDPSGNEFLSGASTYSPIGTFFRGGLLPHEILWQNLGRSIIIIWRVVETNTIRERIERGNPHLGSESEYLAREMLACGPRKGTEEPSTDASMLWREVVRHRDRLLHRLTPFDNTPESARDSEQTCVPSE